ncbi:hypothetical protein H4582DRAFT_921450 [Lactarius indigo]|nr:hypothetical protein H4582DRAFT_921450 [Lactarius indigo]
MLKRQRASSPSPLTQATIPESPPISSDPASSKHGAKRRRIFAPSLDGPSRGWSGSSVAFGDEEDEDDIIVDGHTLTPTLRESILESAGAYKMVNSLLHDLHAEQQHRRIASSAANSDPQFAPFSSHGWSSPVPLTGKPNFVVHPVPQDILVTGVKNRLQFEEGVSVYERYEETNRYLGSVFLERRRDLSTFVDL